MQQTCQFLQNRPAAIDVGGLLTLGSGQDLMLYAPALSGLVLVKGA